MAMFQIKKTKQQKQIVTFTKILMLKNLGLNHGRIGKSDGYNLVLKFEVQISNLERWVRVSSWIFCHFYQSSFFHRAFWDSLILRHFKMNSRFLSLVLLAQKQASTDLSLILRNSLACSWFVYTCHQCLCVTSYYLEPNRAPNLV